MRKIIYTVFATVFIFSLQAQVKDLSVFKITRNDHNIEYQVYSVFYVDEKPTLQTNESIEDFIQKHLQYPVDAIERYIEGTVYVNFTINENGELTDSKIFKASDDLLNDEALRVINLLPQWNPGKVAGKPVMVEYIVPIKFQLTN